MLGAYLKVATSAASGIEYVGGYSMGIPGTLTDVTVSLTSLTGGLASAPVEDDLIVVYFGVGSQSNPSLTIYTYTEIEELYVNDTRDANLAVYMKFMGGTPDTSFLIAGTGSSSNAGVVVVHVWRGVDKITPLDVAHTTAIGYNTALCDPPAITPISPGALIVSGGAAALYSDSSYYGDYSSPELTGLLSVNQTDSNGVVLGVGYHYWTSGTFNPSQFTYSGGDTTAFSWAAITLALRPA